MIELTHDITLNFTSVKEYDLAKGVLLYLSPHHKELLCAFPSLWGTLLLAKGYWSVTDEVLPPSVAVWAAEHLGAVLGGDGNAAQWDSKTQGLLLYAPLEGPLLVGWRIHSFLPPKSTESK